MACITDIEYNANFINEPHVTVWITDSIYHYIPINRDICKYLNIKDLCTFARKINSMHCSKCRILKCSCMHSYCGNCKKIGHATFLCDIEINHSNLAVLNSTVALDPGNKIKFLFDNPKRTRYMISNIA